MHKVAVGCSLGNDKPGLQTIHIHIYSVLLQLKLLNYD
jgi:hypothetical protein